MWNLLLARGILALSAVSVAIEAKRLLLSMEMLFDAFGNTAKRMSLERICERSLGLSLREELLRGMMRGEKRKPISRIAICRVDVADAVVALEV